MTNFQRTADWLQACGKTPSVATLSLQIGCHIEEFAEFLDCLKIDSADDMEQLMELVESIHTLSNALKRGLIMARVRDDMRVHALDALCDCEVTGNGVAYLAGFDKPSADLAVLASNEAKLIDGKPVKNQSFGLTCVCWMAWAFSLWGI
jgi:predicted HAD superfamily Cof-like phosphohydrolase